MSWPWKERTHLVVKEREVCTIRHTVITKNSNTELTCLSCLFFLVLNIKDACCSLFGNVKSAFIINVHVFSLFETSFFSNMLKSFASVICCSHMMVKR